MANIFSLFLGTFFGLSGLSSSSSTTTTMENDFSYPEIAKNECSYSVNNQDTSTSSYRIATADEADFNVIIDFSKRLLSNSRNVEKEFVDFVNENFWNLL